MRRDAEGLPGFSQKGAGRGASATCEACVPAVTGWGRGRIAPCWGPPRPPGAARAAGTSVPLSHRQARHRELAQPPGCTLLLHPPEPGVVGLRAEGRGSPKRTRRGPPELPAWSQPIAAHVKPADAPSPSTAWGQQGTVARPRRAARLSALQAESRRLRPPPVAREGGLGRAASCLVSPVGPCSAPAPQAGSDHSPHAALQVHDLGAGGAR